MKDKSKKAISFLKQGRLGTELLCIVIATQFIYSIVAEDFFYNSPKALVFIASMILITAAYGLVYGVLYLIFGRLSMARIFFLLTWIILMLINIIATQGQDIVAAIIMSFLLTLSVDMLGRSLWALFRTREWKQIFGYVIVGISVLYLILFAIFLKSDNMGEDRIQRYLNESQDSGDVAKTGFEDYLKDGNLKVGMLTYGPKDSDVITDTVDLSLYEKRDGIIKKLMDIKGDYDINTAPVKGAIWYPEDKTNCPVFFMVHGAHNANTPSYMGYEYLARYLASNGYVVVSVDQNIINNLQSGNNIRAILLLENIRAILNQNSDSSSPIYQKLNEEQIAIGGHSRGGEMAATAYLFNNLSTYPDNGNLKLDYHFKISSIVAIAPTVDQYMPASHAVAIEDVNYLLIHGANDQDVSKMMGEKQYNNVTFSKKNGQDYCKASVYVLGANHGQFNSEWGRYDLVPGMNGYLNTASFISEASQQLIAKAYIRVFLDRTLLNKKNYASILEDNSDYLANLPKTVYVTNYNDSLYESLCTFDDTLDLYNGYEDDTKVWCRGMSIWSPAKETYGSGTDKDNYVLECSWKKEQKPSIEISLQGLDMTKNDFTLRIADNRKNVNDKYEGLKYSITLCDINGNKVSAKEPVYIYPAFAIQLYKQDVLFNTYEYKNQMKTIAIDSDMFEGEIDYKKVKSILLEFDGGNDGEIILDDLCVKCK